MPKDPNEAREQLAQFLENIGGHVTDMLNYWLHHGLPADILASDEYPFQHALEGVHAEIYAAVDRIRERHVATDVPVEDPDMEEPTLTALDRCDRCGAQAYVITSHHGTRLLWCAHHFAENEEFLRGFKVLDKRGTLISG